MAKKVTINFALTGVTLAGNEKTVEFTVTDYAGSISHTAFRKVCTCMMYKPEFDKAIADAVATVKPAKARKERERSALVVFSENLAEHSKALSALRQAVKGMNAKKEERQADWKRKALKSLDSVWTDSGLSRAEKFGRILLSLKGAGIPIPQEVADIDEDRVKKLGLSIE